MDLIFFGNATNRLKFAIFTRVSVVCAYERDIFVKNFSDKRLEALKKFIVIVSIVFQALSVYLQFRQSFLEHIGKLVDIRLDGSVIAFDHGIQIAVQEQLEHRLWTPVAMTSPPVL